MNCGSLLKQGCSVYPTTVGDGHSHRLWNLYTVYALVYYASPLLHLDAPFKDSTMNPLVLNE